MHMADALISPAVGGTMWVATAATAVYCAKKVREENDPTKIPLMGVLGAFIFAAQMLNFTIPATGSSGHLGGGLILAILLGPYAAFLTIASVLTVQALFFADGGLLALGCNIFNLGFFPAFVAYPLFKMIVRRQVDDGSRHRGQHRRRRGGPAARLVRGRAADRSLGHQLAAVHHVRRADAADSLQRSALSRASSRPPSCCSCRQAQPEMLTRTAERKPLVGLNLRTVLIGLAVAATVSGVAFAWFASTNPDGLEWSIAQVTGSEEFAGDASAAIKQASASLQEKTAFLPDYAFKQAEAPEGGAPRARAARPPHSGRPSTPARAPRGSLVRSSRWGWRWRSVSP